MMSGGIQQAIYDGYGTVAEIFGEPCAQFRATGPLDPLDNPIGTVQAAFDTSASFTFKAPSTYAKPLWYCAADGAVLVVGDYLQHPSLGTFFVASLEPYHPPMVVSCNRTLTVHRPAGIRTGGVGKVPYGEGAKPSVLMSGWPASMLQGTKGEKSDADLPRDTRQPWYAVLLPAFPGVQIRTDDTMTDDLGLHYEVSSAELTSLGWRLSVMATST